MSEENLDGSTDELLERVLAELSTVRPRPGLEERILSKMRLHQWRRRWVWLNLAFVAPLAATFILVVILPTSIEPPVDLRSAEPVRIQTDSNTGLKTLALARERPVQRTIQTPVKKRPRPQAAPGPLMESAAPEEVKKPSMLSDLQIDDWGPSELSVARLADSSAPLNDQGEP